MYEIRITGFKTKEQANEFASWYEGQGEQDAQVWFEIAKEKCRIDVDFMPVDTRKYNKCDWIGNVMELPLKIESAIKK